MTAVLYLHINIYRNITYILYITYRIYMYVYTPHTHTHKNTYINMYIIFGIMPSS